VEKRLGYAGGRENGKHVGKYIVEAAASEAVKKQGVSDNFCPPEAQRQRHCRPFSVLENSEND